MKDEFHAFKWLLKASWLTMRRATTSSKAVARRAVGRLNRDATCVVLLLHSLHRLALIPVLLHHSSLPSPPLVYSHSSPPLTGGVEELTLP